MAVEPGSETVIPVVEETVRIGKREVERDRVLIKKTVEHHDETIDIPLEQEELSIERVPVGRVVSQAPESREEDGTLIVPVLEERLVVQKQLVLVEEVRVRRVRRQQSVQQQVQLRREDVRIEHLPVEEPSGKED